MNRIIFLLVAVVAVGVIASMNVAGQPAEEPSSPIFGVKIPKGHRQRAPLVARHRGLNDR